MTQEMLSIGRVERRLSNGTAEHVQFMPGVNLLVGRPNTGKTKWLQTLDFLLGDPGENPFEGTEEEGLAEKYDAASAEIRIGNEQVRVERRWREPGARTKVFVDGQGYSVREFQQLLMQMLGIPLLNFPKGNPMSGQTWPELSFRMLLRHIHRRQAFWGGIADLQPEGEQHACLLQFLGLAEHLFTEDYGRLVKLKMEVEQLKARRAQYGQTLDELAKDLLSEPGLTVGANATTVRSADARVGQEITALRERRSALIAAGRDQQIPIEHRGRVQQLGEQRAAILVALEESKRKAKAAMDRLDEIKVYRAEIADEIDRLSRAGDAGAVLADLKVTHCPACDRPIENSVENRDDCFLCHRPLPNELSIEQLGAVRVQFERDRLEGEVKEADQLLAVLQQDEQRFVRDLTTAEEALGMIENELAPARQAVSALIQEEISAIDVALGELSERQRQIGRVSAALQLGKGLTDRIAALEHEIEPLQTAVNEAVRSTDFESAAGDLEDGMNAYLNAINRLRPSVWQHSSVAVDISRSSFAIRIGSRRWHAALGGTDTLYFLMAYQYGLLSLSGKPKHHFPGLLIIDVPGEFSGEAVEDKENFIVQPFVELLNQEGYAGGQLIITGASFAGMDGVNRQLLTNVHVA
jgi:hypothetical protein